MGGGATMNLDLPTLPLKAPSSSSSSSFLSSLPFTSCNLNFPVPASNNILGCPSTATLGQSCTASCCCPEGTCRSVKPVARASGSAFDAIFGPVPCQLEVEKAIAALQNFVRGIPESGIDFNRLQPLLDLPIEFGSLISNGYGRVHEAFRLLQTEPYIKRLVVSLASDRAVWDAIRNNEMVRKLQDSSPSDGTYRLQGCNEEPDAISRLLRWVMSITRAKISELVQKFQALLDEVLQPQARHSRRGTNNEAVDDRVRSSLLLSVVILLIVVIARAQRI